MRISEVYNKDVVNLYTGDKIGNVVDFDFSIHDGKINKIIINSKSSLINILRNKNEYFIEWDLIKKIGKDVILVDKNL